MADGGGGGGGDPADARDLGDQDALERGARGAAGSGLVVQSETGQRGGGLSSSSHSRPEVMRWRTHASALPDFGHSAKLETVTAKAHGKRQRQQTTIDQRLDRPPNAMRRLPNP